MIRWTLRMSVSAVRIKNSADSLRQTPSVAALLRHGHVIIPYPGQSELRILLSVKRIQVVIAIIIQKEHEMLSEDIGLSNGLF